MPKVIDEYMKEVATRNPKAGDVYFQPKHGIGSGYYIVASVGWFDGKPHYVLISLSDGNRWRDAVPVEEFTVPDGFEYIENPQLVIQRSV